MPYISSGTKALMYKRKCNKTKASGTGGKTLKLGKGNRKKESSISGVWGETKICAISRITTVEGARRTVKTCQPIAGLIKT